MLEDVQGELYLKQAKKGRDPDAVATDVRGRMKRLMKHFGMDYDLVILDCPPGLSFAALAALDLADTVIVPFRPDYVSQFALDRVALLIERLDTTDELADRPFAERRYACLPNYLRNTGREKLCDRADRARSSDAGGSRCRCSTASHVPSIGMRRRNRWKKNTAMH